MAIITTTKGAKRVLVWGGWGLEGVRRGGRVRAEAVRGRSGDGLAGRAVTLRALARAARTRGFEGLPSGPYTFLLGSMRPCVSMRTCARKS